jgi:hypothetical protein
MVRLAKRTMSGQDLRFSMRISFGDVFRRWHEEARKAVLNLGVQNAEVVVSSSQ